MMNKRYINIIFSLLIVTATLLSSGAEVFAATAAPKAAPAPTPPPNNSGQALEIAPPVIYLNVNPGQTTKTQIFLRDISSGELIVTGEADDFTAAGEDGTPKLLLGDEAANNPYSMKSWVVTPTSLRLVPKEVKTMAITINVPANASPGGHYGIIRYGKNKQKVNSNLVFWVIPYRLIAIIIAVLIAGFFALRFAIKRYNRFIIGKSGSRRRK
jgi:hypothetical protein